MYGVSEAYKAAIKNDLRYTELAGTITLKDGTIKNISSADTFGSTYIKERCVSGNDLDVGSVYASEFGTQIKTDIQNPYSFAGARVEPAFMLVTNEQAWVTVPLGKFYITDIKRQPGGVIIKALDGMILLDKDLTGVTTSGIPQAIVGSICLRCGVTLATTTVQFNVLANSTWTFTLPNNSKVETCRDLLMWVCQATGSFARFNRIGQLELIPVAGRAPVREFSKNERFSSDISDNHVKITKISTKVGKEIYEAGAEGMTMKLVENPLFADKESAEMALILNSLLAQITTAEYTPCSADCVGDPAIQAGDFVTLTDVAGDAVTAYVTNNDWTFRGDHKIQAAGQSALLRGEYSQGTKAATALEKQIIETKELATASKAASDLIKTAIGGTVLKRENEILIMDNAVPELAEKIWRFNIGGLGYSANVIGADNPDREYDIAITMDGTISGKYIAADSILAGAISTAFKNAIADEITGNITAYNDQVFTVGYNQLSSFITAMQEYIDGEVAIRETETSELQLKTDALTVKFTEQYTGGINMVRNSSGLNGITNEWEYEGAVEALQDSFTAANSCFKLFEETVFRQLIENIRSGKTYTLTFKCRKPTAGFTATVKLTHGDTETTAMSSSAAFEWQEFTATVENAGADLTFVADTTAGTGNIIFIADIMLVEGDTKARWTPAPDEIYTTEVKIDRRGINISNTASDTETIIDNTRFAVKHKGETVITVNKDQTELKKSIVDADLTIGKLKFLPRENRSEGLDIILLD